MVYYIIVNNCVYGTEFKQREIRHLIVHTEKVDRNHKKVFLDLQDEDFKLLRKFVSNHYVNNLKKI